MNIQLPERFSIAWWVWAGSVGTGLGLVAVAVLWMLGYITDTDVFVWCLVSIVLGDVVTVVAFEYLAPTEIVVSPGEKEERYSELTLTATVVSGFAGATTGYVNVKGESWAARLASGNPDTIVPGSSVRIEGRDGLTLRVISNDSDA
jgi:membrane protein implicated in regulation of membrane protease activity